MDYYTCNECQSYDRNNLNKYDEGYCTYYCKFFPKSDRACSHFDKRNDINTSCFLTTAICDIFGFADNCFGLETLRKFRDTVLVNDRKYHEILAQYEVIGPIISQRLYTDSHRDEVAEYYFENYIYDIIMDLQCDSCSYDGVINRYIEMVNDMKRMYVITKEVANEDVVKLTKKIETKQYKNK